MENVTNKELERLENLEISIEKLCITFPDLKESFQAELNEVRAEIKKLTK